MSAMKSGTIFEVDDRTEWKGCGHWAAITKPPKVLKVKPKVKKVELQNKAGWL